MNSYIFREYDIRGVVEEDFHDDIVELLGKGVGTYIREKNGKIITLSGDVRLSTPHLKEVFAKGVISTGVDVVDLGIIPTPTNYYSMFILPINGAVQITGSHNPPDMNGFKITYNKQAVYGTEIQYIREIIEKGRFAIGKGKISEKDILQDYIDMIVSKIKLERNLKVAMDCGNGTASLVASEIFKKLGCEVTELFCEVDGTFPNHHPDPTVLENLTDLIDKVKRERYDFGVAFDGDADRIGIIDDKGRVLWADYIMILFLDEIIKEKETTIIFDVKCSQALEEAILEKGGKPLMWKTGHSLIKQKMKEEKAPFAGEMSGHLFFGDDYFGYDDAIYVAARFAQMISRGIKPLSKKINRLPRYYSTPEMRLECENDAEKFAITKKAVEYFKNHYDCINVDGVRIKFGDGWGLVRASNTQPVIVTRFEAKTEERLDEIKKLVLGKLKEFGKISID
jgi:phosphomannomutase/phosphoglucomutase